LRSALPSLPIVRTNRAYAGLVVWTARIGFGFAAIALTLYAVLALFEVDILSTDWVRLASALVLTAVLLSLPWFLFIRALRATSKATGELRIDTTGVSLTENGRTTTWAWSDLADVRKVVLNSDDFLGKVVLRRRGEFFGLGDRNSYDIDPGEFGLTADFFVALSRSHLKPPELEAPIAVNSTAPEAAPLGPLLPVIPSKASVAHRLRGRPSTNPSRFPKALQDILVAAALMFPAWALTEVGLRAAHASSVSYGLVGSTHVPPYQTLKSATGLLLEPLETDTRHSLNVGGLVLKNGDLLLFTCEPAPHNVACFFRNPKQSEGIQRREVSIKYYTMPYWHYPTVYSADDDGRLFEFRGRSANILMEMTYRDGENTEVVLPYAESEARIRAYNLEHPGAYSPVATWMFAAFLGLFAFVRLLMALGEAMRSRKAAARGS